MVGTVRVASQPRSDEGPVTPIPLVAEAGSDDVRRGDPVSDPGVEGGVDEPNEGDEDEEPDAER